MINKNAKYIAAICFSIFAIWDLYNCFTYSYYFGVTGAIGEILVIVALLISNPIFSVVGVALMALPMLIDFLQDFSSIVLYFSDFAVCILLICASLNVKSAKKFGIVAAIFAIIGIFANIIIDVIYGYAFSASHILWGILLAASAMSLGVSFDSIAKKKKYGKFLAKESIPMDTSIEVSHQSNLPRQGAVEKNTVEELVRFKALLDEGAITQEEFNAVKKKLLNL